DPRTVWRLIREIKAFRPDILHAHDYKTNVLAVILSRIFGVRAMTTMHGYVSRGGRLEAFYRLDRWALRHMDHVIAVSEDLYDILLGLHVPAAKRSLVHNAIDSEQFVRTRSVTEARRNLGLDPSRPILGAVGRLAPEKGFDLLIRAANCLLGQGID